MNVDLLHNIYGNSLFENEKNVVFWEDYLQKLHALEFNVFSEKLTVPVLVPIGNRILFRGELKHTNEVTVALGAEYFVKCSVNQAEILKQHRIKDATCKLESLKKERDYLKNQMSFSEQTIYEDKGYDIVEVVTEAEDKTWREIHRENVRRYKQSKGKGDEVPKNEMSNEELWDRLEELELQEELENEMTIGNNKKYTSLEPHSAAKTGVDKDSDDDEDDSDTHRAELDKCDVINDAPIVNDKYIANCSNRTNNINQQSKTDLAELVLNKRNALKEMVADLTARQRKCETEDDLVEKIDDMEKLEELEDEVAILEDMLTSDDDEDNIEEAEEWEYADNKLKKSVSFADEDDSETFELTFKHSEVEPCKAPYDPQKGITKPSDLRNAFSSFFTGETSILKKSKYGTLPVESKNMSIMIENQKEQVDPNQKSNLNSTIVIRDVVEKVGDDNRVNQNARPMSLFKKKRQQLKE